MDAFNLQSKISLDSSSFFSGLRKSERGMKEFGDKMSAGFNKIQKAAKWLIGGVLVKKGVDAMKSLANATALVGDKIDKQSQALGMSRKAYQEWDYILSQTGGSIDNLGVSMKTLNNAVLSGGKDTSDALKKIGLSADSLKGLSQEDAFEKVVRAFQRLPAGAEKSAAAVKLFGKNGQDLLPLLNSDSREIDILRAKAKDLGLIMSDDAVDASVKYNDALDTLQRTFNGLKYSIGAKILPALTNAFTKITNYAGKIRRAYEKEGISGVFKRLVKDIRNIKWPSWKDIGKAITDGWNTIVDGVKGLAKIVFGENVDGTIAWPDVTKLSEDFSVWWNETALPALQKGMVWALTLFGMPKESAEQIASVVSGWWDTVVDAVQGVLNWALHLPDSPHEAGAALAQIISGWWDGVKSAAEGALKWTLGIFGIWDSDGKRTVSMLSTWWDRFVKPALTGAINFVLGLFGLPSVDDMVNSITSWWEDVKKAVGNLFINIIPNILGIGGEPSAENAPTFEVSGQTYSDPFGAFRDYQPHAKGLWDVPYDDYPALLHEGEMVLTKSQANDYRKGEGPGTNSRAVVSAIQRLENTMANLRLMVGEKEFGRATVDYGGNRMNRYIGGADSRLAAGYGS